MNERRGGGEWKEVGRVLQKGFLGEDKCRSPKGKQKEEKERGKQSAVRVRAEEKIKQGWYISTPFREVVCQCMTLETEIRYF